MAALLPRHHSRATQKLTKLRRRPISWKVLVAACFLIYFIFYRNERNSSEEQNSETAEESLSERAHIHIGDGRATNEEAEQTQLHHDLDGKTSHESVLSSSGVPDSWLKAFPEHQRYTDLVNKAKTLPDVVMIPFEEALANDVLQGWEYEWVSDGRYDRKLWGRMEEPAIDFVYTCQ